MSSDNLYTLRMVIQQLGISEKAPYRLVVYGDDQRPLHSDFENLHLLLDALRAAIPDFDFSKFIMNPLGKGQGSIAFDGELRFDTAQLSLLRLM